MTLKSDSKTSIRYVLHKTHRALYLFTALFSRKNIDEHIDESIRELKGADHSSTLLNIGSGGFTENQLNRLDHKLHITSIDIDPSRKPDLVVDVCNMDTFRDNIFDAIIMIEVLEHIKEPQIAINEIHRVLKPGGLLIMSTPYIFEIHDKPNDFYRFTKYGLAHLLKSFKTVSIKPRNSYLESIFVLLLRLFVSSNISDKLSSVVLVLLVIPSAPILLVLNKLIKSEDSTSGYITKCRK